MDEIEVAEKRRLLREARSKMKPVWMIATKPGRKRRDAQLDIRNLLEDIAKLTNADGKIDRSDTNTSMTVRQLVNKGLSIDPTLHVFYGVRGAIAAHEGKWSKAIRSYETAKSFVKYDEKLRDALKEYDEALIRCYWARGCYNHDNGSMLEAASDYERILIIRPQTITAQDKLLQILRAMNKYEAYRCHWSKFLQNATNSERTAMLLARHAVFKIELKEIVEARLILFGALKVDPKNKLAQELLQAVYKTGYTLAAHTVIWCMHGCYEKALLTVKKSRDCDPYDPGYVLLRTIVLRLSGRLTEAADWLENVNDGFYKLLEPLRDARGSITGRLSVKETRQRFIKQWYLIRYDMALRYATERKFVEASQIILDCQLQKVYPEALALLKHINIIQRRAYP